MLASFLLSLAFAATAQSSPDKDGLRVNPLAPSLREVSEQEQAQFEKIVDRLIQFDIGKLSAGAGKKAKDDFDRLPPEAIFALIDGFNRAAEMEASCPAVVIGKKIQKVLNASSDLELLAYAKETLGAGVKAKRHQGMLKDIQFSILLRKGEIQRRNLASGKTAPGSGVKLISSMTFAELSKAAGQRGANFKDALIEIEKRQTPKAYDILLAAAADEDKEVKALGQRLLEKRIGRETPAQLKTLLKHDKTDMRVQAIQEIRQRKLRWGEELIGRLQDAEETVRQAARQALVALSKGQDFGPERDVSFGDRETAVRRWREWWGKQK